MQSVQAALDPYATALDGEVKWDPAVYGYPLGGDDRERYDADSAPFVPRSVVTNPWFEWGDDRPLRTPWHETVLYEATSRASPCGTRRSPTTCAARTRAWRTPPSSSTCSRLGVTAVELMPVHHFVHDHHLVDHGLRNYWGYNSIGFFAPHSDYSAWGVEQVVSEFKYLVKTMHEAGIEVILDVVYNHTAEGNHLGPMLSFKGIDNPAYYRLADGGRYYFDTTGTGNTLNMRHPHVLQLIIDSLRYWVSEMHVDGFRFDLAASLARQFHEVDRLSAFFDLIQVDPVVSQVKLIAEPWDLGEGGYQVGNFPTLWSEWNGRYRDTVRDYWRGADQYPGRLRLPADRQLRPVRPDRPPPATPASTSSPRTTGSPSPTWSPTTTSTTRRTARTTGTAPTTTARGTAARKARPTTPRSPRSASAAAAR